ncbi:MAG TPA: ABC transporter permease [Candidatus Acidoferrales bacterium]|nr:ABC transporter permease [Candidatus Acidoferrales bacterium]
MKFALARALIIARREYLTTVRRKMFVFSLLLTPGLIFLSTMLSKGGADEARKLARHERVVALVDSSGVFANAPAHFSLVVPADAPAARAAATRAADASPQVVPLVARRFTSQREALDSLNAGTVNTAVVVAANYLESGHVRRYEHDTRAFTETADDRAIRTWLTRSLLQPTTDSTHIDRSLALDRPIDLFVPNREGHYQLKDDSRELFAFFFPFAIALLLSVAIVSGGQYLLQGVAEEKETRILESMLCTVTPGELMVGKLIGLGGAGLTLVGVWLVLGLTAASGMLATMQIEVSPVLVALGITYFVLGYLFYASIMTGLGAIANNLREAQQFAIVFTMMNFIPFYGLTQILNSPRAPVTRFFSLFPPTAPTTMMLRLSVSSVTGAEVPSWEIATSIGLLALTAIAALLASAKIFRIGLLLYGKTPNMPEIMRILRQR